MRPAVIWLLVFVAFSTAEQGEEPWLQEDVEESYDDEGESYSRRRREVYVEEPYEEHVRVKRRCEDEPDYRERRSAEYVRVPRQVHAYEVHEASDDEAPFSPPYEEMLAASAEHYHRTYVSPAQASARYLNPEVSGVPVVSVSPVASPLTSPVQFVANPNPYPAVINEQLIANPVKLANSVPNHVALPVPIPLSQLSDADLQGSAAHQKHHHHHGNQQGGGHKKHAEHHREHGGKSSKGFNSDHHIDKGAKGFKTDERHRKEYEEAAGKKKKHHDHADHKGNHEEQAHGHRGAKFDEKKGHKKGHKTKGYHNKYHKDEFHKEHKFYDDYHKSGEHHRYGKFHAKHASNESGKKKAHRVDAGHDVVERGKKGYSQKGHVDEDHKGYKGKDGHEEHHARHSQHGKKGGKESGSHWGYEKN